MKEYRRIIRRGWATIVAVLVLSASGSEVFAQSYDGQVKQVGLFKQLFGCSSCAPAPACDSCQTIISPAPAAQDQGAQPGQPAQPSQPAQPEAVAPDAAAFDLAAGFDVAAAAGFSAPNMLGDLQPYNSRSSSSPSFVRQRSSQRYKVADNTSPIPRSRVFYNYNYFHNVFNSDGDLHRNNAGAEVAFLDNRASVEVRQSLNSFANFGPGANGTEAGNLVAVFKGLLYQSSDLLLSGGLSVGFPVGPTPDGLPGGNAIIAPFFGYYWEPGMGDAFIQGFSQVDLPTESSDQNLLHTDIGAGFWLRRDAYDSFISGIAPTMELHLYTPLGDAPSGSLAGLIYDDVLNFTAGVTFVLRDNATLALAVGAPLSDRDDYDFEAQVQFNLFWGASRGGILPVMR